MSLVAPLRASTSAAVARSVFTTAQTDVVARGAHLLDRFLVPKSAFMSYWYREVNEQAVVPQLKTRRS